MLLCLSICHTVLVESNQTDNKIIYQSSSPDELALVNAARNYQYTFTKKDIHNNLHINIQGKDCKFQLLHVIEFTSDRLAK